MKVNIAFKLNTAICYLSKAMEFHRIEADTRFQGLEECQKMIDKKQSILSHTVSSNANVISRPFIVQPLLGLGKCTPDFLLVI